MFELCSVSDDYCNYLRKFDSRVYYNKEDTRKHTRKYLGIILSVNNANYYIPMSSPKPSDYVDDNKTIIRKSINTIIRMTATDKNNNTILRGTLRISNMIPVPQGEIIPYNIQAEKDLTYKDVVQDEIAFISVPKNREMITKHAQLVYRQKCLNFSNVSYLKYCCDFKLLEEKCAIWKKGDTADNV